MASMGPRLFSRGNSMSWMASPFAAFSASMGPRLFSRGNINYVIMPAWKSAASMGPRLFSRGNCKVHIPVSDGGKCGFNGATTFQPWKSGRDVVEDLSLDLLQWGHDFSAVEIATAPCSTL